MFKHFFFCVLAISLATSVNSQTVEKLWETDTVLKVPESVYFADTILYVSCINGSPLDKNHKGYIAQLSIEGQIIKQKWAKGLNAPKGLGLFNGVLYVTDIDRVVAIECKTGEIVNEFEVPGAKFLNDIAMGENGIVYFSDMKDNCIYQIKDSQVELFLKSPELNNVNGLCYESGTLYAGTTNTIFAISTENKAIKPYITKTGGIDGLEKVDRNQMIISDWVGKVQIVNTNGHHVELLNFGNPKYNAADITYDPSQKIIYIPTFFGNTVAAYRLID